MMDEWDEWRPVPTHITDFMDGLVDNRRLSASAVFALAGLLTWGVSGESLAQHGGDDEPRPSEPAGGAPDGETGSAVDSGEESQSGADDPEAPSDSGASRPGDSGDADEAVDSDEADDADEPGESNEIADRADSRAADSPASDAELLERDEALEAAVERNHDVEISRRRFEIAERDVSLGNAGFLPSLQATANQNHQFSGSGIFGQNQFFTSTNFGVEASWLVFDGLGRFSTYDRLKIERSVREIERRARVEQTLDEVAVAYYDVVRQRELLGAFQETRRVSEDRLEIARSRLEAGTGSQVDTNLARVELSRDRSAVSDQRIALTEAKTELNRLMGREADREFRVRSSIEVDAGMDYEKVRSRALESNRQLRAARRREDRAAERVDERRAERWPDVRFSLGYNYTEFHSGIIPNLDEPSGPEYTIDVVVPLFDGFNVLREIENAETERTIRDTEVRREKVRIRKAVRDAHTRYRRHRERIEFARESVELAEENVEIALTELEAGTINQVELRQVQLNLQDARVRLIDAKFNAKRAELRLRRLTGELYGDYVE